MCAYVPYDYCLVAWILLSWVGQTLDGARVPGVHAVKGREREGMGERRVRGKGRVRGRLGEGKGEESQERKDNVELDMG